MKTIFAALLFLSLVNIPSRETIRYSYGCETFALTENLVYLNASISGIPTMLKLDFGSDISVLSRQGARKEEVHSIQNQLFSGDKKFAACIQRGSECTKPLMPTGSIGLDFFQKSNTIFHLDFDALALCCLTRSEQETLLASYRETESTFKNDGIYVNVTIKWKSYALKFDTGYNGTISMNAGDAQRFVKESCKSYESVDGKFAVYPNKWITINGNYYNSAITVRDKGVSKIGMGFIKGFNWIIDFKKQKVYLKKNSIGLDSQNTFPQDYSVMVQDGKLVIHTKSNNVRYKLGSAITTMNGNAVTINNNCEMERFINESANLNTIEIQTE